MAGQQPPVCRLHPHRWIEFARLDEEDGLGLRRLRVPAPWAPERDRAEAHRDADRARLLAGPAGPPHAPLPACPPGRRRACPRRRSITCVATRPRRIPASTAIVACHARAAVAEVRRVLDRQHMQACYAPRRPPRRLLHHLLHRHLPVPQEPPDPNLAARPHCARKCLGDRASQDGRAETDWPRQRAGPQNAKPHCPCPTLPVPGSSGETENHRTPTRPDHPPRTER